MPFDSDEFKESFNSGTLAYKIDHLYEQNKWGFTSDGVLNYKVDLTNFISDNEEVEVSRVCPSDTKYLDYYKNLMFLYKLDDAQQSDLDDEDFTIDGKEKIVAILGSDNIPLSKVELIIMKQQLEQKNIKIPLVIYNKGDQNFFEYSLDDIEIVINLLNFVKERYIKGGYAYIKHKKMENSRVVDSQSDEELLKNFKKFAEQIGYPIPNYQDINKDICVKDVSIDFVMKETFEDVSTLQNSGYHIGASQKIIEEFEEGGLLARTRSYSKDIKGYYDGLIDDQELRKELDLLNTGKSKAQSSTMLTPTKYMGLFGDNVALLYLKDLSTVREMYFRDAATSVNRDPIENPGNRIQVAGVMLAPKTYARTTVSHKEFLEQYKNSFSENDEPNYNEVMANLFPEGLVGATIDIVDTKDAKMSKLELLAVTKYASNIQGRNLIPTLLKKDSMEIYEPSLQEISGMLNYAQDVYGLSIKQAAKEIGFKIRDGIDLSKNRLSAHDLIPLE